MASSPTIPVSRPRRRWPRRLVVAAVVLIGLYLLRAPLLRGLASVLIVEDPGFSAEYLLVLSGDRVARRAAGIHAEHDGRILLVEWKPGRLESYGLIPSRLALNRRELEQHGVAPRAVGLLPGIARTDWDVARQVREWLPQHPDVRILVLCHRFDSRRMRSLFGRVLGSDAERVGFEALPERDFDETNWWRHKEGLLDVLQSSLHLAYTEIAGEDELQEDWDPDEYERSLKR
jgi:hypothetical protein